ncbi:hypothetical protein HanXRQr2_Chr17g0785681 [Helianthus annuus]|uniref:Uncharacterized protein n=1 Tax=Helianthus annuus TaxID=4232 RepID=A0A9K3DHD7_HELAN|nr:hypothetical protein HanXRQr2_Chr17g0785681 [Helianthus annuus]KAJ0811707.1 hypothetical protein HanPSC8_Chr17g0753811 [Helianthus annuus]
MFFLKNSCFSSSSLGITRNQILIDQHVCKMLLEWIEIKGTKQLAKGRGFGEQIYRLYI